MSIDDGWSEGGEKRTVLTTSCDPRALDVAKGIDRRDAEIRRLADAVLRVEAEIAAYREAAGALMHAYPERYILLASVADAFERALHGERGEGLRPDPWGRTDEEDGLLQDGRSDAEIAHDWEGGDDG